MSRQFAVDIHAINISAHPHPEGAYENLVRRMFSARQPIQIWGERHALMTELHWRRSKQTGKRTAGYGIISTFTDIDLDAPWLNRETGRAAEDVDTNKIVIPELLRPHFAQFMFHFNFSNHVIAFQGGSRMPKRTGGYKAYSLTPLHMKIYLENLLRVSRVKGNLEEVNITVIPAPDTVNEILRHNNLREITMVVTAPNSDNVAKERGRVADRLRRVHAARKVEVFTARDEQGIQPDPEMIQLARVAALDGRVTARVATNDGVISLSTKDKPLAERIIVDTSIEIEAATIRNATERVSKSVKEP